MALRKARTRRKRKSPSARRKKRSSSPSRSVVMMKVSDLKALASSRKRLLRSKRQPSIGDENEHLHFFDASWEEISPEESFEVDGVADPREVFTLEGI